MAVTRPPRGTRPSNRHALILAAAAELFRTRGYEHVAMGDIAEAVAVQPSALYRHVAGKQDLLRQVILEGITKLEQTFDDAGKSEGGVNWQELAEEMVANRSIGVLWERESQYLAAADQSELHVRSLRISARLEQMIATQRPELNDLACEIYARVVLRLLLSSSFYHSDLNLRAQSEVLAGLAQRVLATPLPGTYLPRPAEPAAVAGIQPHSRREALLQKAIELFASRRYTNVGIEDVADSIGIPSTNVYTYFDSKADVLIVALQRANATLFVGLSDVLAGADSYTTAVQQLLQNYCHLVFGHPALIEILLHEVGNVPEPQRSQFHSAQKEYVGEWVRLLLGHNPHLSPAESIVYVQAVLSVINYLSRVRHLSTAVHAEDVVVHLCARILDVPS